MITETSEASAITAWFTGRLPEAWKQQAPSVTVDREEITVRVTIDPVQLGDDASEAGYFAAEALPELAFVSTQAIIARWQTDLDQSAG